MPQGAPAVPNPTVTRDPQEEGEGSAPRLSGVRDWDTLPGWASAEQSVAIHLGELRRTLDHQGYRNKAVEASAAKVGRQALRVAEMLVTVLEGVYGPEVVARMAALLLSQAEKHVFELKRAAQERAAQEREAQLREAEEGES